MKKTRSLLTLLACAGLIAGTTVGVVGCSDPGPAEEAGRTIDDAFDDTRDGLRSFGDDVQDAAEDAADSTKDAAEEAGEAIEGAVDDIRN